jgi:hypothetical protein
MGDVAKIKDLLDTPSAPDVSNGPEARVPAARHAGAVTLPDSGEA